MWHNVERIEIAATPERVWAVVADVGRHRELAGSGELQQLRVSGPIAVGATWEADETLPMGVRFTARSTCLIFDPPTEFSWTSVPPPIDDKKPESVPDIRWWFRLFATDGGTVLEHEVRVVEPPVLAWKMRMYYMLSRRWPKLKAGMRGTLANVKNAAEGAGAAPR